MKIRPIAHLLFSILFSVSSSSFSPGTFSSIHAEENPKEVADGMEERKGSAQEIIAFGLIDLVAALQNLKNSLLGKGVDSKKKQEVMDQFFRSLEETLTGDRGAALKRNLLKILDQAPEEGSDSEDVSSSNPKPQKAPSSLTRELSQMGGPLVFRFTNLEGLPPDDYLAFVLNGLDLVPEGEDGSQDSSQPGLKLQQALSPLTKELGQMGEALLQRLTDLGDVDPGIRPAFVLQFGLFGLLTGSLYEEFLSSPQGLSRLRQALEWIRPGEKDFDFRTKSITEALRKSVGLEEEALFTVISEEVSPEQRTQALNIMEADFQSLSRQVKGLLQLFKTGQAFWQDLGPKIEMAKEAVVKEAKKRSAGKEDKIVELEDKEGSHEGGSEKSPFQEISDEIKLLLIKYIPELTGAVDDLGVFYQKLFQSVAGFILDLSPASYQEIRHLLGSNRGKMNYEKVVQIVEADLGRPIEVAYSYFEKEPFAVGTVAQVHRARVKNPKGGEREVVVKVLNPEAERNLRWNIRLNEIFFPIVESFASSRGTGRDRFSPELIHLIFAQARQLSQTFQGEFNFKGEAQRQNFFRVILKRIPHFHIPAPLFSHSGSQVITSESVQNSRDLRQILEELKSDLPLETSRTLDHPLEGDPLSLDPEKVDRVLDAIYESLLYQVVYLKEVHSDPNMSNFLLDPNGELHLVDFGQTLSTRGLISRPLVLLLGFLKGDASLVLKKLSQMGQFRDFQRDKVQIQKLIEEDIRAAGIQPKSWIAFFVDTIQSLKTHKKNQEEGGGPSKGEKQESVKEKGKERNPANENLFWKLVQDYGYEPGPQYFQLLRTLWPTLHTTRELHKYSSKYRDRHQNTILKILAKAYLEYPIERPRVLGVQIYKEAVDFCRDVFTRPQE